jgi:hypothetical protein
MKKLIAIVLLISLYGCHKEKAETNQAGKSQGAWPFIKGNYWIYTDSLFTENGNPFVIFPHDTTFVNDSINFQSKYFYGPDGLSKSLYYRQDEDHITVEGYEDDLKTSYILFKQVSTNNTIIYSEQSDDTFYLNGNYKNYHVVKTLTGYTDVTKIDGYDCIRNELVETFSGDTSYKQILYVKPGVGLVRLLIYNMKNETPGSLFLQSKRDLVGYKLY